MSAGVLMVPLFGGGFTLIDAADEGLTRGHVWRGRGVRASSLRYVYAVIGRKPHLLHRVILGSECSGLCVDHINGDGLDNRRVNLRACTHAENMRNRRELRGSSRFKGVWRIERRNPWRAGIQLNGRTISLGSYPSELEAARAYDAAAHQHFGEFALTNKMLGLL